MTETEVEVEGPEDIGDRKTVERKKLTARLKDKDRLDYLKGVLASPQGRAWVWDMLSMCGVFHNPMRADAADTAFACGEMNVGQKILADVVRADPGAYVTMMNEANDV